MAWTATARREQNRDALRYLSDLTDRHGAPDVLKPIRQHFPWLHHIFADSCYAGDKLKGAMHGNG